MARLLTSPEVAAAGRRSVHGRSPSKAALWSLLTVSLYGLWWWWDLNRQLSVLGQRARPWRSLGQVTLGWVVVAAALTADRPWLVVVLSALPLAMSLMSVQQTTAMLAAVQDAHGGPATASVPVAVCLAAAALVGAVAWFALSVLVLSPGMLVGVLWPLVAMAFVAYMQGAFNDAVRRDR